MAETRNMKKRNSTTRTVSSTNKNVETNTVESEPVEVKIEGNKVGTTNQKYAQMLDFAALERILTQNVNKTVSRQYTTYAKSKITDYLQSPLSNIDNIRDVSNYIYRISSSYRMLINYYANMPLYSYNVVYKNADWNKPSKLKDFMVDYQNTCKTLENMRLMDLSPQIMATAFRDGIYTGFTYGDEDSFFIQALDPKYIKISGITENNTYIVRMDMKFFDQGNNKEFLYGIDGETEGTWDKSFVQFYEDYKSNVNFRWAELDPARTICVICGDDPLVPLPFFTGCLVSLLDLLDYQELIRDKTELENTILLLSKVPLLNNGEVDDYAVSLDVVRLAQQMIDSVTPSLAASAWSPCELEVVRFDSNQVQDTNVYSQAVQNLFETIGVSQSLFSSNKNNSVGLRHSIRVDEALMFTQLTKLEANIQRYIKMNTSEDFNFYFHKATIFGQDEYITSLQNMATLGIPVKTDLATITKTPYEMMNSTFMESAMGLTDLWKPLSTSYTQNDNGESGGQKKKDDDLSDEGLDSRDSDKNEGTKAGNN